MVDPKLSRKLLPFTIESNAIEAWSGFGTPISGRWSSRPSRVRIRLSWWRRDDSETPCPSSLISSQVDQH
jgi:hypothetical protein